MATLCGAAPSLGSVTIKVSHVKLPPSQRPARQLDSCANRHDQIFARRMLALISLTTAACPSGACGTTSPPQAAAGPWFGGSACRLRPNTC